MKHFIKTTAILALASFVSISHAATNTDPISPQQKTNIESIVKQYILNNPEVLVEALQKFQRKQYEQAEQTVKKTQAIAPQYAKALFNQANDPVGGNPKGQVTIVEFFDYQCPHCIDMAPVIDAIIKANSNVRVIYKDFPIRGPLSLLAARAGLAANNQGKYVEFNRALLENKQPISETVIFDIAKQTGVNVEQLKKDMNSKAIDDQIKANIKLAQDLKLFGTPAYFIGKTNLADTSNIQYIPGGVDQQQMQGIIDKVE